MRQCDEVDTQRSTQHYLTFIILLQNNIKMEEMSVENHRNSLIVFIKIYTFLEKKNSVCKELRKQPTLSCIWAKGLLKR